tara:strand:+ start:8412 stop:9875 length:1464 start_codon:yes stop_codon:yes gene_type:complete
MRHSIPFPARPDKRPLCIAHRGASAHAVENTLAAFAVAAELGADMWEIDVQLTRDGQPVVSHDAALTRIFGGNGEIAGLTLAEIRERAPDLPTLDEVIALARQCNQALYVEIKARGAGRIAIDRLLALNFARAGLGSFSVDEVSDMVAAQCPYPLTILVPLGIDPFERASQSGADIIHLCWEQGGERPQDLVTPDLLANAAAKGLGIVLWHDERKPVLDDLLKLPVLGICTNQPELLAGVDSVDMAGIEIVCHRGANRFAPENTLAAARLALDQGCPYVEIDIRESADGELVVIHDATLERTTDGRGRVAEHSLSQLRALDAGAWFSPVHAGERIPTLAEMIALCQAYGAQLYIENKCVDPAKIIALLQAMGFAESCFHWSADDALHARLRAVSAGARIKSSRARYPGMQALKDHLAPEIVEIDHDVYESQAVEAQQLGLVPMLHYFGDDPAVFDRIVVMRPAMINLNRADLLLAALRRASGQGLLP